MWTHMASAILIPEFGLWDENQWEACSALEQYLKCGQDNLENLKWQCFQLE